MIRQVPPAAVAGLLAIAGMARADAVHAQGGAASAPAATSAAPMEQDEPLRGLESFPFSASLALGGGGLWGFLHYLFVDTRFDVAFADDRAPFALDACSVDTIGGTPVGTPHDCKTYTSVVGGYSLAAKSGLVLRWFIPIGDSAWQVALLGGIGHRGIHLKRQIDNCRDCPDADVHVDGGVFVSPEVDIPWVPGRGLSAHWAFGVRSEYERYLNGDLVGGLWISAFAEGF